MTVLPPMCSRRLSANRAEMMRVSTTTVRHWIAIGALPAIKIGGTVRIRRADLDAILDRRATPTEEAT